MFWWHCLPPHWTGSGKRVRPVLYPSWQGRTASGSRSDLAPISDIPRKSPRVHTSEALFHIPTVWWAGCTGIISTHVCSVVWNQYRVSTDQWKGCQRGYLICFSWGSTRPHDWSRWKYGSDNKLIYRMWCFLKLTTIKIWQKLSRTFCEPLCVP